RIQDELNRWLDKIVSGKSRTMVIVATNAYEKIREDIRRRLSKVSLNDGVTREMLLAVVNDSLKREGWVNLKAEDLLDLMKPKVSREDLGGLHDVKNKVLNHIALAFNPSMRELGHQSNPRFFLLGPPGTGKTLLAMVAAAENNVGFIKVRGGELMSGANYMGDPEKRIKDLFGMVRQKSPCILLLDEADAIFWGGDPSSNKILAQV